jgi:hypothetical protein
LSPAGEAQDRRADAANYNRSAKLRQRKATITPLIVWRRAALLPQKEAHFEHGYSCSLVRARRSPIPKNTTIVIKSAVIRLAGSGTTLPEVPPAPAPFWKFMSRTSPLTTSYCTVAVREPVKVTDPKVPTRFPAGALISVSGSDDV